MKGGGGAEYIGLTTAVKISFGNVVEKVEPSITPYVIYYKSFGGLDVYAEVDYTAALSDSGWYGLYIAQELGYNFGVIESGTLTVILSNENTIQLKPELGDGASQWGNFVPSLKWTQGLGFGDMYLQVGPSIDYLTGVEGESALGFDSTLGWDSKFGLGAYFTLHSALDPEDDPWYEGYVYYIKGPFFGTIYAEAWSQFKMLYITPTVYITPHTNRNILTFYTSAMITLVEDVEKPSIMPEIGVKYSF
ncbi:MAG: hypothetical protein LBJ35_01670 [Spirochaetaceae bacterium]|nr:hypothetical protein [Spirochaetaceae bacterium]